MKKLLVIAVLSLFVASAYADTKFDIFGHYEIEGRYIGNNTVGDSSDTNRDAAYMKHLFRFWGRILVDDKTSITFRTTPVDRRLGQDSDNPMNTVAFDRAWITYEVLEGLRLSGGRITGGNYDTNGFGSGYYVATFSEFGQKDGLRADYMLDDNMKFFLAAEKSSESSRHANVGQPQAGDNDSGRDSDAYILGADLAFNDLYVKPRLVWRLFTKPAVRLLTQTVRKLTDVQACTLFISVFPTCRLKV